MEANTIDMIPEGVTEVYHTSQYDNGRVIRCNIVDGSNTFALTGSESIVLRYKKMNGEFSAISVPNTFGSKSYVDVTLPEEITNELGITYCKLRIKGIGAKAFYLVTERRP